MIGSRKAMIHVRYLHRISHVTRRIFQLTNVLVSTDVRRKGTSR